MCVYHLGTLQASKLPPDLVVLNSLISTMECPSSQQGDLPSESNVSQSTALSSRSLYNNVVEDMLLAGKEMMWSGSRQLELDTDRL